MKSFHKYIASFSSNILLPLILTGILFSSCSDDEPSLTESFFKIYDDSNMDLSYRPIDVVETADGFIILTGTELNNTDFMGVQLIKLDEQGNYLFDQDLDDYVVPIGEMYLNTADSITHFFAMNPTSLEAVLISINTQLEIQSETLLGGINYPLSSSLTSAGELLLQSYDPLNQEIQITEVALDATTGGRESYSIGPGSDVEAEIISHYLNASERPLPFFCGEVSAGNYYFNGFYNYSFSLVFTDLSATPSGVVQGQSSNAGIRAAMPLGANNFAIAGYQFDENFQLASQALNVSGISSSVDLFPGNMAEIKPYTNTKILNYTVGATSSTVFACETKSNQILLRFYDSTTGEVEGVYNVGYLNPFTFASIKASDDGSLLVLGTTFVAGRFERITLTKISRSEISDIIS